MQRKLWIASLLVSLTWHGLAFAQSAPAAPPPTPPAASPTPPSKTLGLTVVLASLAVGTAITVYGLSFDCGEEDHGCHRRANLPIFGGVGFAAAGSIVGLVLLPAPDGSRTAALTLGARFD